MHDQYRTVFKSPRGRGGRVLNLPVVLRVVPRSPTGASRPFCRRPGHANHRALEFGLAGCNDPQAVLKQDKTARLGWSVSDRDFRFSARNGRTHYYSLFGKSGSVARAQVDEFKRQSRKQPMRIPRLRRSGDGAVEVAYWLYQGHWYATDDLRLSSRDVLALVSENENKRRLKLEKAHALMAMTERLDTRAKRQSIPQEVKVAVWQRDQGRCTECASQLDLEYDHIIPLSMGGANTDRNLQLLCSSCNRRKGASLG